MLVYRQEQLEARCLFSVATALELSAPVLKLVLSCDNGELDQFALHRCEVIGLACHLHVSMSVTQIKTSSQLDRWEPRTMICPS